MNFTSDNGGKLVADRIRIHHDMDLCAVPQPAIAASPKPDARRMTFPRIALTPAPLRNRPD
jgi:hypothetical protein